MLASWKESYDKPRQCNEKHRHHFADESPYSQRYAISSSHVWMWEFDHKEGWALKNWCFWTVVLEKILESPLDCKEIKLVNPKVYWPWIFIGKTDAEANASVLWPPDAKSRLIRKDPDAGEDWRQKKRATEGETVGWHHRFSAHELGQTPVAGEGQGGLSCCSSCSRKELDMTWRLNNNTQSAHST